MRFKSYEQFNESIADIFKSAHAAIDPEDLVPLEGLIGKPRFPSEEEFQEAVDYLGIDPIHLYYNPKDIIAPIMYWDGPIYEPFHGGLNMEALKMMRVKDRLDYKKKDVKKFLDSKDYDRLFTFMDKKILIPSFIKMYDDIPDKDKYEIFKDLYVRSEYGFQSFPLEIIKDCFSKRKLSVDWKKRIEEFNKTIKLNSDGTLTVYRGENVDSAKGDDAFSWTLNKKTAKFFADRFSKGSGRITEKDIKPEEVIDFLEDRGEAEIILFPKKFGKINESVSNKSELPNHSLSNRSDLRIGRLRHDDKDCKSFLTVFRELAESLGGYSGLIFKDYPSMNTMSLLSSYNLDTNSPSLEFEDIRSVPKEWLSNKIDNTSAFNFLLGKIDPDFLGDESEATFHRNTMNAYQPVPSEEIQKFCNRYGYTITYTLFSLKNDKSPSAVARNGGYKNVGYTLIVTFVKDLEMMHKHRGTIQGKKFGL
jgi:hypothetical protein